MGVYQTNCNAGGVLTGTPRCAVKITEVKKIILTKPNFSIALAQLDGASFAEVFEPGVIAGNVFPLPIAKYSSKSDVAPTVNEVSGEQEFTGDPERRLIYELKNAAGCLGINLRQFNNQGLKAFFVDSKDQLMFRSDGVNAFGYNLSDVWFDAPDIFVEYGKTAVQMFRFNISANELSTPQASIIQLPFPYTDINGIVGVDLSVNSFTHSTTGTIVVDVVESCNQNTGETGLIPASFKVVQGGSTIAVSTATESTTTDGRYTLSGVTMTDDDFSVLVVPTTGILVSGSVAYTVPAGS